MNLTMTDEVLCIYSYSWFHGVRGTCGNIVSAFLARFRLFGQGWLFWNFIYLHSSLGIISASSVPI